MASAALAQTVIIGHKWSDSAGWYDAKTGKQLAVVPVGVRPHEMVWSADHKFAYVTNYGLNTWTQTEPGGNTISVLDATGRREVAKIDLGENHRPHGIERGHRTGRLFLTVDLPASVLIVDPVKRAVAGRVAVEQKAPHMLAVTRDESRAYTANAGSASVSMVPLDGKGKPVAINVGGVPMGVELTSDERMVWATTRSGNQLVGIDTRTNKVVHRIDVKGEPARLRILRNDSLLLTSLIGSGELAVIDLKTRKEIRRLPVGKAAEGMLVSGQYLYISAQGDNKVVKFDMNTWTRVLEIPTADRPDPIIEF